MIMAYYTQPQFFNLRDEVQEAAKGLKYQKPRTMKGKVSVRPLSTDHGGLTNQSVEKVT